MSKLLFEGSEKKMEIIFSPTREPLRNKPESFWKKLCHKAQAHIVSRFSNSFCDSYILSESSLFIWDHRLLMLTCGETSLINSILAISRNFKKSDINLLFYQRKNEFFPYKQKTSFMDDLKRIQKKIPGKAYCFGVPDEHHFYLFHSEGGNYSINYTDRTIEILMYDLDDYIKNILFKASSAKEIRKQLGLDYIFENAQVDDYIFKPVGYSLNGLTDQGEYYTIHITPQEPGFYVSFETNIIEISVDKLIQRVLSIFKPFSFDIIVFSSDNSQTEFSKCSKNFICSSNFSRNLECGYHVHFAHFFKPFSASRLAFELTGK
ncbi:MAG: hypothetical protein OXM55_03605 [Bdellovibrionales bacterium]|nr:hypothetical protein [Bdellovibrionales bacterium]